MGRSMNCHHSEQVVSCHLVDFLDAAHVVGLLYIMCWSFVYCNVMEFAEEYKGATTLRILLANNRR